MQWAPETGAWLAGWMKYQVFTPLFLLQLLNIFWYFLILRILFRYVWQYHGVRTELRRDYSTLLTGNPDDDRSDDEGDGEEDTQKKK